MRRRVLCYRMTGWVLALALCGHASMSRAQPPDVYVLLVDTLRADHLTVYGYDRNTSPALNEFAKSSLVFTNVAATSSWTLPSVGSLFTGRYPTVHGLRAHGTTAPEAVRGLRPGLVTMPSAFEKAGYYTAAIIANVWLQASNHTGAERGFMHYEVINRASADQVNALAEKVLAEHADRPVFLYLHYMEPHAPYAAPAVPAGVLGPVKNGERPVPADQVQPARHMVKKDKWADNEGRTFGEIIDAYDRTIREWDQSFGKFVQWLREHQRLERSWISVVADHGEEIFEHRSWGHGTALWQEQTKIPWVLRGPGGKPAGRLGHPLSVIDVAPTMLTAAGVPVPRTMNGLDARSAPAQRTLFAEVDACRGDWHSCYQRAVWDWPEKLFLQQDTVRVFNLRDDPGERSSRPSDPRLLKLLKEWATQKEQEAKQLGQAGTAQLDPATRERLHALGY
jgi:arylsulfatase A-like enzyme